MGLILPWGRQRWWAQSLLIGMSTINGWVWDFLKSGSWVRRLMVATFRQRPDNEKEGPHGKVMEEVSRQRKLLCKCKGFDQERNVLGAEKRPGLEQSEVGEKSRREQLETVGCGKRIPNQGLITLLQSPFQKWASGRGSALYGSLDLVCVGRSERSTGGGPHPEI